MKNKILFTYGPEMCLHMLIMFTGNTFESHDININLYKILYFNVIFTYVQVEMPISTPAYLQIYSYL